MTTGESTNPLKKVSALLGGIGEYVAAVIAYIVALTGGAQTPYPQTISVLTALATSATLWFLRWPQLAQKSQALILPEKHVPAAPTIWNKLLGPFWAGTGYAMSPLRRRLEGGLLLAVSLLAVVFSGTKTSTVYNEISWLRCGGEKRAFKIVVAKFTLATNEQTSIESQLISALERDLGNTTICYYRKNAGFRDEAIQLGKKYEAALVIWGSIDAQILQIGMEPTGWDALGEVINIPYNEALEFRASQLDEVIPFLSQFILSEVLYMRDDLGQARDILKGYLSGLDAQEKESIGFRNLAQAHFFLGMLLDPEVSGSGNERQAFQAYNEALQLNPELGGALLNRGQIFYNRGEYKKAVIDLRASIQIKPDDADTYQLLGITFLLDHQFDEAIKIYIEALPYLDDETRNLYIDELESLASDYPNLKEPVEKIILILREGVSYR